MQTVTKRTELLTVLPRHKLIYVARAEVGLDTNPADTGARLTATIRVR